MKHSKRYTQLKQNVDPKQLHSVQEAVNLAKETSNVKFDATIELNVKMNLDTTKAEQQLRGTIALPYYFGKTVRALVLDDSLTKEVAEENGIKLFGGTEQITKIKEGWLDFDLIITIPKFMPELSKLGKVLGPKGLMPNPKLGTVTTNVVNTFNEFKKGKYNYRTDTFGNIHMGIGKVSSATEQVVANIDEFLKFLASKRPSTVKGEFIQKVYVSSSMGPSFKVELKK